MCLHRVHLGRYVLRQVVGRDGRGPKSLGRGKAELQRVGCQVTPGRREATERATENKPPVPWAGKGEKVG